jgi:hypothetical protein
MGSGALMLVKKSAFQAVGGFEPVKSAMLDDVMFAQLLKRKGHSVAYALAPDLLRVRLFKNSRDAFWGPTKNILSPFQGRMWLAVWFALPITLLPFFIYGTPLLALGFATGNYLLLITGAMTYALQYVTLFLGREQSRFDPLKTLCFPLISIVTTCCIVRALYYHFAKGAVMWRGRAIVVEGRI